MKWKHSKLGWIAQTYEYCDTQHMTPEYIKDETVIVYRELENKTSTYSQMPIEFVLDDDAWQPIPDDRWTEYRFTIREFLQAFNCVVLDSHDATVLKSMADKQLTEHIKRNYQP